MVYFFWILYQLAFVLQELHKMTLFQIVTETGKFLTENACGVTIFSSSSNLQDKRASNDRYILLNSGEHSILQNIDQKITVSFT